MNFCTLSIFERLQERFYLIDVVVDVVVVVNISRFSSFILLTLRYIKPLGHIMVRRY